MRGFWRNLRDLPGAMIPSAALAGLVVVLVSYTGPVLIIIEGAKAAGLTQAELASWLWALTVGSGVTSLLLSLWYRQPIITAWSTAGVALLVTSLPHYGLGQAVGAYIVASLAVTLVGMTRVFGRAMGLVPQPIALGMLTGVLVGFGLNLFKTLPDRPLMVMAMLGAFYGLRRLGFRAPSIGALAAGALVAWLSGDLHIPPIAPQLVIPVYTAPIFSPAALLGLALPLFILTMTSQNAPGFAVLRNAGYTTPVDGPIAFTGLISLLGAPFGGSGVNLAAITAAICANPEAHPDATKRYTAGVATGVLYIICGMYNTAALSLFSGFPRSLSAAVAGLALLGAIGSSLSGAMAEGATRDGALVALLVTASGMSLLGIGAPFWGLVFGMAVYLALRRRA